MTDLTHVSTTALVRELAGREGVQCMKNVPGVKFSDSPATILVVRGERE